MPAFLVVLALTGCGGAPVPADPPGTPAAPAVTTATPAGEPPPALRCGATPSNDCFVRLAGGTARLGGQGADPSAPGFDARAAPEDGPPRTVEVGPFWLQVHEVRAAAFEACVAAGACRPDDALHDGGLATVGSGVPDAPAAGVTWAGAGRYCAWLGGRLPTEAEWTLAARGTEGRRFPWGPAPLCPYRDPVRDAARTARLDRVIGVCGPMVERLGQRLDGAAIDRVSRLLLELAPEDEVAALCGRVGSLDADAATRAVLAWEAEAAERLPPATCAAEGPVHAGDLIDATPEGVRGLAGSLAEWTADAEGEGRIQKGGSWMSEDAWGWRGAARAVLAPDARLPDVGFRCAF